MDWLILLWDDFLLLCLPGNLWLDVRHCEFYLVEWWILLHSVNVLEICSAIWLSYLDIVYYTAPENALGLIFPTYWGNALLSILSDAPLCTKISTLACRNVEYFQHCVSCGDYFLGFFWGISPRFKGHPLQNSRAVFLWSSPIFGLLPCWLCNCLSLPNYELRGAAWLHLGSLLCAAVEAVSRQ